jgi:membrane-associated phospholipid phosphatase
VASLTERQPGRTLLIGLILAVVGLLILPFDTSIIEFVQNHPPRGEFKALLQRSETFGHGTGIALILVTLFVVSRPEIRRGIWIAGSAYGAGIAANILKVMVVRTRPGAIAEDGVNAAFRLVDLTVSPLVSLSEHLQATTEQSCPSAHTATAFGMAVALGTLFPRGRVWFLCLAGLVGLQRISTSAHFPSDVCWGASIGIVWGVYAMKQLARLDAHPQPAVQTVREQTVREQTVREQTVPEQNVPEQNALKGTDSEETDSEEIYAEQTDAAELVRAA